MGNDQVDYGSVTDYSMHFNMGTNAGRGFTWGSSKTAVAASLAALTGDFATAGTVTVNGAGNNYFAGNVGIGTTSPAAKLHVYGGDSFFTNNTNTRLVIGDTTVANDYGELSWNTSGNYLGLDADGTQYLVLQEDGGNVGIGTTTPYEKLEVAGAISASGTLNANASQGPVTTMYYKTAGDYGGIQAADFGSAYKNLILQEYGSYVGIGTTTPDHALTVYDSKVLGYAARITNGYTGVYADGLLISLGIANASRAAGNYFIGFSTLDGTVAGKIQGGASAVAYTTTAADLAEYFSVSRARQMPKPGEIVALDPTNEEGVMLAEGGSIPFGIVATNPGFLGNGPICREKDNNCDGDYAKDNAIISLAGQVPVKINLEGGAIAIGDKITLSSVTGVGKKATATGETVVGIALATFDKYTSGNTVLVFVGNDTNITLSDQIRAGLFTIDLSGTTTAFATLLADQTDTVWSRLTRLAEGFVNGVLTLTGLKTEKVETDQLCIGATCVTEDQLKALLQASGTATTPMGQTVNTVDMGGNGSGSGSDNTVTTSTTVTATTTDNPVTDSGASSTTSATTTTDTYIGSDVASSSTDTIDTDPVVIDEVAPIIEPTPIIETIPTEPEAPSVLEPTSATS
ncbi:hypothetical protein A2592_01475 [Candidatus Kaiserbacteria bacterium RIFOXYD1_FULL_42_15]|uniref:Uncharacterized protein n=1 Tax=Candidatus Kaiserbacteria bacterium RIFOXYD1_FULL_42_15 TaxID=1798532 RepID=A0A1F6FPZ3_9BACT|nr:MAG: hypothetical protein A2592_01475 [Candidatus Kaiserbacteria bacterium RIFOXYD1_FULL_42_15]